MKKILLITLLTIIFSNIVLATPPDKCPCSDVKNPEYYKNSVFNSKIYSYFQGWELKNVTVPCHCEGSPTRVVLEFDVPKYYSINNINYHTKVTFLFKDNQLVKSAELEAIFKNYKQHIRDFENQETIKFFIEETGANYVMHSDLQIFLLESQPREYISYNFIDKSIEALSFNNSKLIDNLDLFIPKVSNISQFAEFQQNVGVHCIQFYNNKLSISENFSCPTCTSYFLYDMEQLFPIEYCLNNNFNWVTFPEVSRAHNIIKERLNGDLSSCTIATGNMHNYTIMKSHLFSFDSWFMTVALQCDEGTHWRDIRFKLNPDGTYDRLEVIQ